MIFGDVVVVGSEDSDASAAVNDNWHIGLYNEGGGVDGSTSYNGPANGADAALAVAVDQPAGNIIVAGYESGIAGGLNWRIRKYDGWVTTFISSTDYDGPVGGDDSANAIALDADNNIYVAGYERSGLSWENWRIRKYDPSLTVLLATAVYDGPAGGPDIAYGIDVNGANVCVVGKESGLGGSDDWAFRRYDNALNLLDEQSHDGVAGGADELRAVSTVNATTVYISAYAAGSETVRGEGLDMAVARYDFPRFLPPGMGALNWPLSAATYGGFIGLQWIPLAAV
ncbi:MAG: hypothetical protein AAB368_09495, partial [bacterium]